MDQPDLQSVFIDSTLVRASVGSLAVGLAPRSTRSPMAWAICWIHPDGQAENWLALAPEGVQRLAADKGYDSDALIETLTESSH